MKQQPEYTLEFIIQYSVVGFVLLAAMGWILWKIFRKQKNISNSCCGCSLYDNCDKNHIVRHTKVIKNCESIQKSKK